MPKTLTDLEVQERLTNNFYQNIKLISHYISKRDKITLECSDCGHIWSTTAATVLYSGTKHRCPNCGIRKGQYFNCANCGKEIYRVPSDIKTNKSQKFYCSHTCGNIHKNDILYPIDDFTLNTNNYRRLAFGNFSHICSVCGYNEDIRLLEIHHKDKNRNNNDITNLIILCPLCHRKITLGYYKLEFINNKYLLSPIDLQGDFT